MVDANVDGQADDPAFIVEPEFGFGVGLDVERAADLASEDSDVVAVVEVDAAGRFVGVDLDALPAVGSRSSHHCAIGVPFTEPATGRTPLHPNAVTRSRASVPFFGRAAVTCLGLTLRSHPKA